MSLNEDPGDFPPATVLAPSRPMKITFAKINRDGYRLLVGGTGSRGFPQV